MYVATVNAGISGVLSVRIVEGNGFPRVGRVSTVLEIAGPLIKVTAGCILAHRLGMGRAVRVISSFTGRLKRGHARSLLVLSTIIEREEGSDADLTP